MVGRCFADLIQNMHFSRESFSTGKNAQFLDCYLQSIDPQHLYFTQEDVDALHQKYGDSFGDYLMHHETTKLAQELYGMYAERVQRHLAQAEAILRGYERTTPTSGSERTVQQPRCELPHAEKDAKPGQAWREQVEDNERTVQQSRCEPPHAEKDAKPGQAWRQQVEDNLSRVEAILCENEKTSTASDSERTVQQSQCEPPHAGNDTESAQVWREKKGDNLSQVEAILREDEKTSTASDSERTVPTFDSDRTVPRSRRKLPRAKNDAELDQVWRDQVEDMMLSEVCRRENIARLAAEKGKPDPNAKEPSPATKILSRLKRVRMEVQEADEEDMVAHVLNAVAHVYDPHSDYMGVREEKQFKDSIKASLVGIGAQLREDDDGSTKIEGIVKGGPADKNGQLKLGDHVVAVDADGSGKWTDILFMSIDKVVNLVRGKKNVPVRLRVQSDDGGEERVITIVRDEVPLSESLASARIVDIREGGPQGEENVCRLGILTLPSFYMDLDDDKAEEDKVHCAKDVRELLMRMEREKVRGLVLDLRANGGGSLEEVRKMVGLFTGSGPVVQVRNARGEVECLKVSCRPIFSGELVVLTSKASASASEIFAGAMKDYGRALIVGDDTTFGKGTVQVPRSIAYFIPQADCGLIKVTIQKFYRVNGASTQLKGVSSDIVLPTVTTGLQLGEAELDNAMPYDAIAPAGGYVPDTHLLTVLPKLRERSNARVAKDGDLQNNAWFANYRLKLIEENSVSLNKGKRQAQIAELRDFRKKCEQDRKVRYEAMSKEDAAKLTIYRLNLDDVKAPNLPRVTNADKESFMREAKDPEDELDDSPDYPSGLDPVLREALYIARDMVELH